LGSIPVTVEQASGNLDALLHEIRHALGRLLADGTVSCIDLKALPLAPGEEPRLLALLGSGEVRAEVRALGTSEITETAYAGAWIVTHRDERGEILTRFIEICRLPKILLAQDDDIALAVERLGRRLSALEPSGSP
jgi:hydrogenase-1 operon protein HyaF